ncbi:hypothetical protein LXL04_023681 [Taraxacum kok-saghyz]
MASVTQLKRQYIEYTTSLYHEGYLNDQFMYLQKLQSGDDSDPDFVSGLASVFFKESEKILNILATAFQQKIVDSNQATDDVHLFRGCSSNVRAQRLMSVCLVFLNYCKEKNLNGCLSCLQQANHEYIVIRNKLEALFKLDQQILQAGGSVPMMK